MLYININREEEIEIVIKDYAFFKKEDYTDQMKKELAEGLEKFFQISLTKDDVNITER